MYRHSSVALITLLLAGCGGGGGGADDTAVSANPPAPVAAAPSPAAPAPVAPAPSPGITLPPAPPKPAAPPAADSPAAPPAAESPTAPPVAEAPPVTTPPAPVAGPTVSGSVIARSLGQLIAGPVAAGTVATSAVAPNTQVYVKQNWHFGGPPGAFDPGSYYHASEQAGQPSGVQRVDLPPLGISATNDPIVPGPDGSLTSVGIGPHMLANGAQLERQDGPVDFPGEFALNGSIAEWFPVNATLPWFVQLQTQFNPDVDKAGEFRICWHAFVPNVRRLSCGKFDMVTSEFRGAHIVDDSYGLGALTWTTP
jgi:hypothetical protein